MLVGRIDQGSDDVRAVRQEEDTGHQSQGEDGVLVDDGCAFHKEKQPESGDEQYKSGQDVVNHYADVP